ncbi:MAG: sulfotransferase [Pseudomonadota bacterium]
MAHTPVFIVGTGRCGSTLMSNLINLHPDILSLSEVFVSFPHNSLYPRKLDGERFWNMLTHASPVLRKVINPVRSPVEFTYPFTPDSPWTMADLPACMYMTLPHFTDDPDAVYRAMEPDIRARPMAPLADQYRYWFDWMTEQQGKKLWMERTGNSITMVKALHRLFPDAKFVHIHRDGREVAMSIQKFMPLRLFLHMWKRLRYFGVDLLKTPFRYADSFWIANFAPYFVDHIPADRLLDMEPDIVDVGKFWSAMITGGMKDLARVPSPQVYEMTYADLVTNPRDTLDGFMEFAAPDLDRSDWLDKASQLPQRNPAAWQDLPADQIAALEKACAPGMELLGYAT